MFDQCTVGCEKGINVASFCLGTALWSNSTGKQVELRKTKKLSSKLPMSAVSPWNRGLSKRRFQKKMSGSAFCAIRCWKRNQSNSQQVFITVSQQTSIVWQTLGADKKITLEFERFLQLNCQDLSVTRLQPHCARCRGLRSAGLLWWAKILD